MQALTRPSPRLGQTHKSLHANRRHRYRHQFAAHDRRTRAAGPVVRDHRSREGDGPSRRRRPRRAGVDARRDARGAASAVQVRAPGGIARGGRDRGGRDERDPRGRKRRRVPPGGRRADRDPCPRHLGHRGSPADSPGRVVRRQRARAMSPSSSTSAAAASRSRAAGARTSSSGRASSSASSASRSDTSRAIR